MLYEKHDAARYARENVRERDHRLNLCGHFRVRLDLRPSRRTQVAPTDLAATSALVPTLKIFPSAVDRSRRMAIFIAQALIVAGHVSATLWLWVEVAIVVAVGAGGGSTGAVTLNSQEIIGAQETVTIFKVTAANGSVA